MINILLITTWNQPCGIAEHSWYLKDAVERADPEIRFWVSPELLNPTAHFPTSEPADIVHLNYHAALHSRWTYREVQLAQAGGHKVVITYHDTGVPNSEQCKALHSVADAFIIHEPADDLPGALYWRMGVPAAVPPSKFGARSSNSPGGYAQYLFKGWEGQPVLGSIGFPFGWKNYDQLAKVTEKAGWALLLIAPGASDEQIAHWLSINPDLGVWPTFADRGQAISLLAGCDATAFTYVCHNTGQSAAILQGIAARKPVIALETCRQFRALYLDRLGHAAINWCETFEEVQDRLMGMPIYRIAPWMVALAEQDSWARVGQKYAQLYRSLV